MALDWIFYLNLIFSIGGIIFFIYSLIIVSKIKSLFPGSKVLKRWIFIQCLIILFLFGYIFNIIFIAIDQNTLVIIMTAIVYLFGGLFVLLVIDLSYKTYKVIISQKSS